MTQILFGQSYFLRFDPKLWAAMQPYPPLQTMLAAAVVRAHGIDTSLFDPTFAGPHDGFERALEEFSPERVVVCEDDFPVAAGEYPAQALYDLRHITTLVECRNDDSQFRSRLRRHVGRTSVGVGWDHSRARVHR